MKMKPKKMKMEWRWMRGEEKEEGNVKEETRSANATILLHIKVGKIYLIYM